MPTNRTVQKVNYALVKAQVNQAPLCSFAAATKQASYYVEAFGDTLANLVYLRSGKIFDMSRDYFPDARIDGVVSGCEVTSLSADNFEIAAGVVNVAGVEVTVNADATNSISAIRPATGKYAVYALTVTTGGVLGITKGADGDAVDLTGGYGGAGQKPYVDGVAVIAYAWAFSSVAGVIPADQILYGESANVDFDWLPLDGGLALLDVLELNRTGGIPRPVHIQCYDLAAAGVMKTIGTISDGTLTIMRDTPIETTGGRCRWKTREAGNYMDWAMSATHTRYDDFWVEKMTDPDADRFLLEIKEDRNDSKKFLGYGILNGEMPLSLKRGVKTESINFVGDGELIRKDA